MFNGIKLYGSATIGSKGQIVIPAEAREELQLKEGEKVIIVREPRGSGVVILKANIVEDMLGKMQTHLGSITESMKKLKDAE